MRISDWSSDVCSSDLEYEVRTVDANNRDEIARIHPWGRVPALVLGSGTVLTETVAILFHVADRVPARHLLPPSGSAARVQALSFLTLLASSVQDRKSVVEVKSVSVRLDLGGRRIYKKKKKTRL